MRPQGGGSQNVVIAVLLAVVLLLVLAGSAFFFLGARAHEEAAREAESARMAAEAAAAPEPGLVPPKRLDVEEPAQAVVPWEEAGNYLGQVVAVEGRIVRAHNSGRACFLNFAEDWQGKFHGVIFASAFAEFPEPPEQLFQGRRVRMTGKVAEHQGAPQIVIERPSQIQVLDEPR